MYRVNEIMDNRPTLLTAVTQNKVELVQRILKEGAKVNATGHQGMTALMLACSTVPRENLDSITLVKTLLNHGADPNKKDSYGRTALMYAFQNNLSFQVVETLLLHKADYSICDKYGSHCLCFINDCATLKRFVAFTKELENSKTLENNNVKTDRKYKNKSLIDCRKARSVQHRVKRYLSDAHEHQPILGDNHNSYQQDFEQNIAQTETTHVKSKGNRISLPNTKTKFEVSPVDKAAIKRGINRYQKLPPIATTCNEIDDHKTQRSR